MGQRKYQIILLKNNENIKLFGSFTNKNKVFSRFNEIMEDSNKVVFPTEFENYKKIFKITHHLAIIKRKDENDITNPKLKNEYGEYVEHVTDSDEWVMLRKEPFYFEETFFVYGENPRHGRKTFSQIYENFVNKYKDNKYEFLNIWIYKNKVCFESASHMDMVICKLKDDAIRMVTKIEEWVKRDKNKYVMFSGDYSAQLKYSKIAIEKIQKLTNWNRRKVTRYCTRP